MISKYFIYFRVSIRICYPFLYTQSWRHLCKQIPRFLSLFVSNSTHKKDGVLCYYDANYTVSTITSRIAIECNFHSRYVIFYNTRAGNLSSKIGYSDKAEINLCEVEVWRLKHFWSHGNLKSEWNRTGVIKIRISSISFALHWNELAVLVFFARETRKLELIIMICLNYAVSMNVLKIQGFFSNNNTTNFSNIKLWNLHLEQV